MFKLEVTNMDFDPGLQIVQGDVCLWIDGRKVINEALCIDIGLPSLLRSATQDLHPNRLSDRWEDMPFFVCGCGDPDCKAFSFMVKHEPYGKIELTEIEEKENRDYRIYQKWIIDRREFSAEAIRFAEQFLTFVAQLDYQPFFPQSVHIIKELVGQIKI